MLIMSKKDQNCLKDLFFWRIVEIKYLKRQLNHHENKNVIALDFKIYLSTFLNTLTEI